MSFSASRLPQLTLSQNKFTGSQYYINRDCKQSVHECVPDRIELKAPTRKTLWHSALRKHMAINVILYYNHAFWKNTQCPTYTS